MRSYGKHTIRVINIISVLLIFTCIGCSAIKVNEEDEVAAAAIPAGEEAVKPAETETVEKTVVEKEVTETSGANTDVISETIVEEKPERVIALSKSNAELWLLAGGELIATSDDAMKLEGISEDTVSLGDMDHVNLEAIAALEPDLLILFSTDPAQKALGESAEALGFKVYYTNIDGYADYETVMTDLTKLTGREDLYETKVTDVREEIDEIISNVPAGAEEKTYLLLHVSATKSKVEKNDYFASEIFNRLGLKNIAADNSAFDELSLEQIVAADPDYIFVVTRGDEKKALDSFDEMFKNQPAWEALSAVNNGQYHLLSKDLFGLKPNDKLAESYKEAYALLYGE